MSVSVTNIAAYLFVSLDDLPRLRECLLARAQAYALKGTVLLASEGINLFLAGRREDVDAWLDELREDPRFTHIEVKYSLSAQVPFRRLKVRIKREIIRMNEPTIRPEGGRAPAVAPATLARWLQQGHDDEGRPLLMLDTRNAFEVDAGTFDGALDWRLDRFTQFPQAVREHRDAFRGKTVVSFCTGGIRCEKAAIYMTGQGIEHVYQLDGGILKYFEQTDGFGYRGTCFVFDERQALDPKLCPQALAVPAST